MGDVAMTVPVIRALTLQNPELKITVLTKAIYTSFFRDLKKVSIHTAEVKGKHKGLLGLWKLSRELKRLKIDAVADIHNVLRSNILKRLLPVPFYQIDKGRAEKKALTSGHHFQQLKTTHQRYADVLGQMGFQIDFSQSYVSKPSALAPQLKHFLEPVARKTIGIAPFAAHLSKMYPLVQMKEVIEELSKVYNVLLFGGGKAEEVVLDQFEKDFEHVTSMVGKLSMEKEMDIISNLEVMLSMDSGNAHISAMLGVKTITIWGVTHPYAGFMPFNQPEDYMLLADRTKYPLIPTSIYGNKYPKNYEEAAGSISVEEVVNKVKSVANNSS